MDVSTEDTEIGLNFLGKFLKRPRETLGRLFGDGREGAGRRIGGFFGIVEIVQIKPRKFKNSEVQKLRISEVQKFRSTEVRREMHTKFLYVGVNGNGLQAHADAADEKDHEWTSLLRFL